MRNIDENRSDLLALKNIPQKGYFTRWQGVGILLHSLILVGDYKTVLEIGTGEGYTAVAMSTAIKDGVVYTVDINNVSLNYPNIVTIQADSKTLEWDKKVDLLYIDGDHEYDSVLSDFNRFSPFVNENGVVVFHDSNWKEGVRKVVKGLDWNCVMFDWYFGVSVCQRKGGSCE